MSEDHLAWSLIAHSLHHLRAHLLLSQHLLPSLLVTSEQLQLPAHHVLHVRDDHHSSVCNAVIVPVIHG